MPLSFYFAPYLESLVTRIDRFFYFYEIKVLFIDCSLQSGHVINFALLGSYSAFSAQTVHCVLPRFPTAEFQFISVHWRFILNHSYSVSSLVFTNLHYSFHFHTLSCLSA
jgi:hypothetical protein